MKKIIFALMLFFTFVNAELIREPISMSIVSRIPIVDIRTTGEWRETGIVKGSIPIQFFDERGRYDIESFLKVLNEKVDTKKQFGIICHSGSRTKILAKFLSEKLGYKVVDFKGGILYAKGRGIPFEKYNK